MKKSIIIVMLLFLSVFVFSSTVSATVVPPSAPQILSVVVQEPDTFYSPCTGNDIVNIEVNATYATTVVANFSGINAGIDCGSGSGEVSLSQSGNTWTGSCDVGTEAQGSNFDIAGPIIVVAIGTGFAMNTDVSIVLYNMTTPPGQNPTCERATTTNLCEELDFTQVNFLHEIEVNGSAGCNNEQAMPWGDIFQKVVTFNFSSLDFSSQDIGDKLARLGSALQVYVTPPGQTGDSYVYVNTTAFAELDSDTTVTIYGLPFADEPAIIGESSALSSSYVLNSPYEIEITYDCDLVCDDECDDNETCYDSCFAECNSTCVDSGGNPLEGIGCYEFTQYVPNGDLTFAVSGFSQYNITDTIAPTITFNTPQEGDVLVGDETYVLNVDVTIDGTGTQLQSLTFVVDDHEPVTYDYFDLLSLCTLENSEGTILTCQIINVSEMSRGTHTITVTAVDLGGSAGNSAEEEVSFLFDNILCGATINESLTLLRDMDCSGSSTDGLNPLQDVTIDCNGHSIFGGGAYKGINNRGYNGVTVENCNIYGFETGIYATNSNGLTITNNNISRNYAARTSGIYFEHVWGSTISDNRVFDNDAGMHLVGSYQNTISSNTVEDNNRPGDYSGYGILLEDSCYGDCEDNYENTLTNNIISGHSTAGIYSYYSYDNNITGGEIYDNEEGIRLESSTANIKNVELHDNLGTTSPTETGIYVDWDSTANVENGEFLNNGDYGILDEAPKSVYWTITGAAKCINNSVEIADGSITFDGGTLELDNCVLTLPDADGSAIIAINDTISSLDFDVQPVTSNTSTDFNFSESAVELTLSSDVTTTMAITGETPGSSPTGFTALNGIDIIVDTTTDGALTSALIKIYYTHAQLTTANIAESSLKIYYYNVTSGAWQYEADQGVDSVNDYVWVRVTHFSLFGTFGTAPSTPTYYSGGGGGGSSYYKKNTTSQMTSATTIAPISFPCSDDWICDEWSACDNGVQTRQCGFNDYPECTRTAPKPETQQACSSAKQEAAWTSPGDQQELSPVSDVIKQGITGAAAGAQYGISVLAKQLGIGIAVLVVIAGIAAYLLFLKK